MRNNNISDCTIIDLPKIENRSGNITVIENNLDIPFEVKRIFYLYDIPGGESRGAHAHKECHQFLVSASGSFEVHLDDGINKKTVMLNQPYKGLNVPPGIWASEINFSSGAICLVMTSDMFDKDDYIRDYQDFLKFKNEIF